MSLTVCRRTTDGHFQAGKDATQGWTDLKGVGPGPQDAKSVPAVLSPAYCFGIQASSPWKPSRTRRSLLFVKPIDALDDRATSRQGPLVAVT